MRQPTDQERAWVATWQAAGPALTAQRRDELRRLTWAHALAASEALLGLVEPGALPAKRRTHSGLVEQQALFHRQRR